VRVAILSTAAVDVPPRAYGGTERFVADLAEGLVARGHDVEVFATGRSRPAGRLRWHFPNAIWPPNPDCELQHATWAWRCIASDGFDVVHVNGPEALAAPGRVVDMPTVMTVHHGRSDEIDRAMAGVAPAHLVAISHRQAELAPELGILTVIHHGVATRLYAAGRGDGDHVAFLGRFAPEKAPHLAIDAARAAGVRIRLAAPDWSGQEVYDRYFDKEMRPRLQRAGREVEWLGELDLKAKLAMVGAARALLVPIMWEEPFGLVMIEAMLVGTPVIAFARGSAPEIVEPGVTGFLVDDVAEMAARIPDAARLDRSACRARALERWSATRMAADYERLYAAIAPPESPVEAAAS
jgi:glycosyltransferase involved in cell wall biosynthesis